MIERIISQIITELGPTGLLIIGLYFAISIPLNRITKKIENINIETFPTKESILECTDRICEHIHGKN